MGEETKLPSNFWLLKKATWSFIFFTNVFISYKYMLTYELTYVTNFYICIFLLRIWGGSPPRQYLALYTKAWILLQFFKNDPSITKAVE